jgi:hypothetical protein
MQMFGHRKTVTRADRARLAEELTEIGMALGVNERACCCPARPLVRVMLPAAGSRPELVDLLLCGHHYRASQAALRAAGAVVYDQKGELIMDAAPRHRPGRHQAAVAAPPAWLSALWLNSCQSVISVETCHFVPWWARRAARSCRRAEPPRALAAPCRACPQIPRRGLR